MYVLILTIFALGSSNANTGTAVHSVPGFKTAEQCQKAAQAWQEKQPRWSDGTPKYALRALCVAQ